MTTKICIVIRSFDHPFMENHFWGLPPYTRKIGLPESEVVLGGLGGLGLSTEICPKPISETFCYGGEWGVKTPMQQRTTV